MSFAELTEKEEEMFAQKKRVRTARRDVLEAKPKDVTREQFAQIYKSVTRRIPKTLAILAK